MPRRQRQNEMVAVEGFQDGFVAAWRRFQISMRRKWRFCSATLINVIIKSRIPDKNDIFPLISISLQKQGKVF
jgi:hypothetical protein